MKALVLTAYNQFEMQEVAEPQPDPGEVVIAVHACGICGSDVHGMDGSTGRRQPPIIMGHEASGVIARCGDQVRDWAIGDRVTFDSTVYCGLCAYCRIGNINLCNDRRVLGVSCDDYRRNGAFADYVVVPERILYRLPDQLSFTHAAMVEPVSVAVHAVRRANLREADVAVVFGAGMIGLLIVQVLRARGCALVIAVDVDDSRLARAQAAGAAIALNATRVDAVAEILTQTCGAGVPFVFEAVGTAETVKSAIRSAAKGGTVVLVGNVSPNVEMTLQRVVTGEISLLGSCASAGEYPECLDLMTRGLVNVEPMITATATLAEGPHWFARLHAREEGLMKVILTPEHATR